MNGQEKIRIIPIVGDIVISKYYSDGSPKQIAYKTADGHSTSRFISYSLTTSDKAKTYYQVYGDYISEDKSSLVNFDAKFNDYDNAKRYFDSKIEAHPTCSAIIKEFQITCSEHYR